MDAFLVFAHVIAAVATGALSVYAVKEHRDRSIGLVFAAMTAAFMVWSLGSLARAFTLDPSVYVGWTTFKYVGVATAPVWFFLFAFLYGKPDRSIPKRATAALLVVPAVTLVLLATTQMHGLFYTEIVQAPAWAFTLLETERGPAFWMFALYGWGLLGVGTVLLLLRSVQRLPMYRVQSAAIVAGIAIPWAASVAYIFADWPNPALDPTPLAFAVSSVLFAGAIFRMDVFEVVLRARAQLFETLDEPVIVLDDQRRIVDTNPPARTLLKDLGLETGAVWPPVPALAAGGPRAGMEKTVRLEVQGGERVFRYRWWPLGPNERAGSAVVMADTTRLHRSRERLARANEGLEEALALEKTVLEATGDGIVVVDLDGDLVDRNKQFDRMWHVPETIPDHGSVDALMSSMREELEAGDELQHPLDEEVDDARFEVIELEDGRILEHRSGPQILKGEIIGRVWTFRDATQQRRAQQQIRNVLEAAPDGIILLNEKGIIQRVNREAESMFGYDRDELRGEHIDRFAPNASLQLPPSRILGVGYDLHGVRKDGTRFPIEISASSYANGEDQTVVAVRDMTERREIEQELEQAEQIKEINAQLAQANEDLRQFAFAASHDLQEPVRMVATYVQLLQRRYEGKLDEDADEYIKFASQGARRIRDLIKGLLKYSRVDTRASKLEPVDLEDLVEDVCTSLGVRLSETNAEVQWESLPTLHVDRDQLGQVFQNLLENAIKYRKEGVPPRIHIDAEQENSAWLISVADNGIGLDPEHAEKLFTIFQQGHSPDRYEGQGVGLALCKKIIRRHGGDIWATGKPGEGATFQFTLPAHPQATGEQELGSRT